VNQASKTPIAPSAPPSAHEHRRPLRVPLIIAAGVVVILFFGAMMVARAGAQVNHIALSTMPVGVTAVRALATTYRPTKRYVGTILPWVEAKIGPQLISAYVGAVLVRPGDRVRRGQVIGTLDCRNASATSKAVSMQAKALQTEQQALAHEASRIALLQQGGFASANEIERKQADSASKEAELLATRARLQRASLEVDDCILRAPFDGEVSERTMDPGAYVHPGESIAAIVDRTTVRVGADVPEEDFDLVKPGVTVAIHTLASGRDLTGVVARRSPAADKSTRTVHFEVDFPDPKRLLPVGTTAEITAAAGAAVPATEIPIAAASVKGDKATLFVANGNTSRKLVVDVLGEHNGALFLDTALEPGTLVIQEGRSLLKEGDRLVTKVETFARADSGGTRVVR
jgi:membrane fusion protein (multidrug efflux system)